MIRNTPQTLAYEPLDSEHILACARVPVDKVLAELVRCNKIKWLERLKSRAKFDCCRKVENLEIEAWYSKQREKDKNQPDVYKFYCRVCETYHNRGDDRGYCHVFFCVGGNHPAAEKYSIQERPDLYEARPHWEFR